jgi:hypothetical protein
MGDALHAFSWAAGYNLRKAHAQRPLGDGAAPPVMGPLECMQRMAALVLWPPVHPLQPGLGRDCRRQGVPVAVADKDARVRVQQCLRRDAPHTACSGRDGRALARMAWCWQRAVPVTAHRVRIVQPVVLRASRSRWACCTCSSG